MAKGKRVSNKRGGDPGARGGHVRLGYWRQRKLAALADERSEFRKDLAETTEGTERQEIESALKYVKRQARALIPKRLLHQPRGR